MDPFSLILGAVTIFSTLYGVHSSISAHEDAKNLADKQIDLANSNLELNKEVSQKNFELSQEQFEYQKELNNLLMEREDNAFQRQVADLAKAGFSPLMASGGASAQPLNAGTAPQMDISGVNTAMSNLFSAYNDIFNRKLNRQQFSLQNRVQTAQMYTNLLESRYQQSYLREQIDYLRDKHAYENIHGFRDLNWKNELLQIIEAFTGVNPSSASPDMLGDIKDSVSNKVESVVDDVVDNLNDNPDVDYNSNNAYAVRHPLKTLAAYQDRSALIKNPSDKKNRKDIYGRLKILQDNFSLDEWLNMPDDVVRDFCKGDGKNAFVIPSYYYKRLKLKEQYGIK